MQPDSCRDRWGHRWTGWPGARCYYCGAEDQMEVCLAADEPGCNGGMELCSCVVNGRMGQAPCSGGDDSGCCGTGCWCVDCPVHTPAMCPVPVLNKERIDKEINAVRPELRHWSWTSRRSHTRKLPLDVASAQVSNQQVHH